MRKEKHLRIRVSENQMKQLIETIVAHDITSKSEFVRQAIKDKIEKLKPNGHQKNKHR